MLIIGRFDPSTIVDNTVTEVTVSWIDKFINFISAPMAGIMEMSRAAMSMDIIKSGLKYVQLVALTLVAIKIIYEGIGQYILYESGDDQADPTGLLVRTAQTVAAIVFMPWITEYIFEFGVRLMNDAVKLNTGTQVNIFQRISSFINVDGIVLGTLILIIVLLVIYIVIFLQMMIRGAEIALLMVIGPVMALGLTSNNKQLWSQWLKQFIVICTSQALQIFLLKVTLSILVIDGIVGIFTIIAWLWVTMKSPKILKELSYSSGIGDAAGGMARSAGSMVLMRMMTKR